MKPTKKSILGSILNPILETQDSKLSSDIKKHQWQSSPYWPAKGLFQFTCANCGASVIGKGSPHIQNDTIFTLDDGKLIESKYKIKCSPWNWSPDWPPTKKKS